MLVQRTADDGLRFGVLGDHDRFEAVLTGGDAAVLANEVGEAGALHQQLGHDRVVVVVARQMTIGAALGFVDAPRGWDPIRSATRHRRGRCAARWC